MSKKKVSVEVRNGDINKALKVFKNQVYDSGHLQEVRDRQEYTKPTTARRKEKLTAIRNEQRRVEQEKTNEYYI